MTYKKEAKMNYNFSQIIDTKDFNLQDFIDKYTLCVDIGDTKRISDMAMHYQDIFTLLQGEFQDKELLHAFERLAYFKISYDVPYIILSNEIYSLKSLLILSFYPQNNHSHILELITLFKRINDEIAHIYLLKYIAKLISMNNLRRNSLADLVEKNIIQHYESHLIWLTSVAEHIRDNSRADFPELDDTMCNFGKWLHSDAKLIIQNNSKYESIKSTHENLHLFSRKIFDILHHNEYHILITYLEKCELISLSIGTELALLDQIQMNKKITKDSLTGALNREALHNVFESQYELSLATSNPFILAMCDLDHFKRVNDTYGHVAGDKMLAHFVATLKQNIRNSDIVIRYGGEEFIIMLPTIRLEKGYEVLQKVRDSFEKSSILFNGEKIQTTVSIGMMVVEPHRPFSKTHIDEHIMIVDQKLYIAKEKGRNRVQST